MKKLIWKLLRFFTPYEQPIYYSPIEKQLFQVKFTQDNGLVCGGFTTYATDARTNIQRQILSYDYVWNCKKIDQADTSPYLELCKIVHSYKVK